MGGGVSRDGRDTSRGAGAWRRTWFQNFVASASTFKAFNGAVAFNVALLPCIVTLSTKRRYTAKKPCPVCIVHMYLQVGPLV